MLWKTAPRAADTPRPENPDAGLYRTPFPGGNRKTSPLWILAPEESPSIIIPAATCLNDVRQRSTSKTCDCRTNRVAVYAPLKRCSMSGPRACRVPRLPFLGILAPSGSGIIKGPGLRIEMDVRRCWRCPACGREARVPAWETALRCACRSPGVWMKLIEPTPRPTPYVAPPLYDDADTHAPEEPEMEAAPADEPAGEAHSDNGPDAPPPEAEDSSSAS